MGKTAREKHADEGAGGGVYRHQRRILIDGKPLSHSHAKDALSAGITLIYQEMQLAPNLTVAENIFLGSELSHGGLVQRKEMLVQAQK